jgi:hypothetical protein
MLALGYNIIVTAEELRAIGITEHRDEKGRPLLKSGDRIVSRGLTLEQFAAHKTITENLSKARSQEDYLNVCVFYLREIFNKNHPFSEELSREINFRVSMLFRREAENIWKRARELVRNQK